MKIRYSPHAQERLKKRKIPKTAVRLTLTDPDSLTEVKRNRIIARKRLNGETLEIIFVKEPHHIIIVTLYEITIAKN